MIVLCYFLVCVVVLMIFVCWDIVVEVIFVGVVGYFLKEFELEVVIVGVCVVMVG